MVVALSSCAVGRWAFVISREAAQECSPWRKPWVEGERELRVVVQFGKEASQTRDYWVAKNATLRAARPGPSLRKER